MNRRQIDRFFDTLAREVEAPTRAFITGAAAAALWGRVRPSVDIDFALDVRSRAADRWREVEQAVERATRLTGIPASFAQDIDRWGMITLLDYKRTSRPYRRFGKLEVRLLHPINWSIGKLTRLLEPDVEDVIDVFKRRSVDPHVAARTWGRALRASPPSTAQFQFRRHVEHFVRGHGRRIWGAELDLEDTVRRFHRAARIPLPAQADRHQLATTRGTSNVGPTTIRSAAAQNTSSPWDSGGRPQASGSARSGKTTRRVLRPWRSSHATARPSRRHRGGASR